VIAHNGIGFSPFGIDDNGNRATAEQIKEHLTAYGQEFAMMTTMMRELALWSFDGKITAVIEREDHGAQTIELGTWQATVSFGGPGRGSASPANALPTGKTMFIKLDENKFIAMGTLSHLTFKPIGANVGKAWQYLKVEEGSYENGAFKLRRILNGDETDWGGPGFGASPTVLQISLIVR
ncbi:MAG TPA: DUF5597 domain-containing protein, partial [Chitinophagaceae bacterium]|nr:DUF5597 domain-containing protein [Chitinophagaceae bacterium]